MPAKRENRRRAQSRRGALALALICALTLAAGFALDALMPPGGAADEGAAASASPLRISEVMASNASAHRDAGGAFCDWVELVNTGAQSENVGGFRLVDGEKRPCPADAAGHRPRPRRTPCHLLRWRGAQRPRRRAARPLPHRRGRRGTRPLRHRRRARRRGGRARPQRQRSLPPRRGHRRLGDLWRIHPRPCQHAGDAHLPRGGRKRQPARHFRGVQRQPHLRPGRERKLPRLCGDTQPPRRRPST